MIEELGLKIDKRTNFIRNLLKNNTDIMHVIKMYFDKLYDTYSSIDLFVDYIVDDIWKFCKYNRISVLDSDGWAMYDSVESFVETYVIRFLYNEHIKRIRDVKGRKD